MLYFLVSLHLLSCLFLTSARAVVATSLLAHVNLMHLGLFGLVFHVTNMKKTLLRYRLWTSRGYAKGSRDKNISEANMFSVLPNFVLFHVCFNVICNFAQLRLAKLVCETNKSESFYDNARCLDCTVYNRRFRIRLIYDFNFNSKHEMRN